MTTNKPGSVNQQPLYSCAQCYESCSYHADHLRVYNNECWCQDCWDYVSHELSGGIDWADLAPFKLAPQPTEQKPPADGSLTPAPDELFAAEFAAWWEEHGQFCRAGGGEYERTFAFEAWRYLYTQLMSLRTALAEQQPAPDVAGLVTALEEIARWTDRRASADHPVATVARKALAAYRKQGGKS